jgi:hypothetical protein
LEHDVSADVDALVRTDIDPRLAMIAAKTIVRLKQEIAPGEESARACLGSVAEVVIGPLRAD